ncbi:hypothetical protein Mgra_00000686 [Meloidogyne graminicola]|uniref:S1 motif domain-containing protein n=1 Tax=Meloidogyne graminicola TaxID=189291 RepID=A0A8T0A143_9BILA|nr:hypothetical protein Mgra_00000686 [Meloidogyne graminicola]
MCTEIDFPRGGSSKIFQSIKNDSNEIPRERKRLKSNLMNDNLHSLKKNKNFVEIDSEDYSNVFRQNISIELLAQNVIGLAFVKFVGDLSVTLECVDGIRLLLPADRISTIFNSQMYTTKANLNNIFHKGQAFAFTIVHERSKSSDAIVSICPYDVNKYLIPASLIKNTVLNGIISGFEDKGVIIDLGFSSSSVKGFVQTEHLPSYLQPDKLFIGQVALFAVREKPGTETRVIKLTGFVGLDSLDENDNINSKQLMPGTIVQVTPDKMVSNGLFVSIKNGPKAYIRKVHLPPRLQLDSTNLLKHFRACVVCVQPHSSLLVLNAHPDIIALSKLEKRLLPENIKIGSSNTGTIYYIDKMKNLYFNIIVGQETQNLITAKCFRVNIDNFEESKFAIGSEHTFRVIGYFSMERQLNVSMKKSHMKQNVFSVESAVPCAKISGEIKAIKDNGLIVKFGNEFYGFVSSLHLFDIPVEDWQKRFKKGQKLICRVLFVDPASNKIMLTAKPSLIKKFGNEKFISKLDSNLVGAVSTGVVIKQLPGGSLLIAFFNRITGVLRSHELIGLPESAKQVGCSIKIRVQSVNPSLSQILLEQPIRAVGMEIKKENKLVAKATQRNITLNKFAKPFRIYTAEVVGAWPYGGTSFATTAELLLPGGSVGRLHVSELDDLSNYSEGSCPMQVLTVSKRKSFPVKGKKLLEELRKSNRIVECTARCDKLNESRRKLSILNYRSEFNLGNVITTFIVKKSQNTTTYLSAEINPDFTAIIPKENIKINSKFDLQSPQLSISEMFDNGELRFGRVIGVNKTNRGKVIVLELIDPSNNCVLLDLEPEKNKILPTSNEYCDDSIYESDNNTLIEGSDVDDESIQGEEEIEMIANGLESVQKFEQTLVINPNAISNWISYINYLSNKSTNSKKSYALGKKVAERALQTITFELNGSDLSKIWQAYLNLEVLLGTEKTLKECFKRACAATEPTNMHRYLINLLKKQSNAEGRETEIRGYFESLIKKTKYIEIEPWFSFARHLLKQNDTDQFRQLLFRAIECTEKRKRKLYLFLDLVLIKGFSRLEEQYGDVERSKTMQKLIINYKEEGKEIDIQSLKRAIGVRID